MEKFYDCVTKSRDNCCLVKIKQIIITLGRSSSNPRYDFYKFRELRQIDFLGLSPIIQQNRNNNGNLQHKWDDRFICKNAL